MNLPETLMKNPHFARYYRTWEKNQLSIVFVPLAQICREQGLLAEAREICEKGLAQHPHSVSGRLLLARVYFDLEEMGQARRLVEEILAELPAQKEAHSLLQKILRCCGPAKNSQMQGDVRRPTEAYLEGTPQGAPTSVNEADGIFIQSAAPLWENVTMAKIYADQGEIKIALQIVERIIARDPQNERARHLREEWQRWRS